MKTEPAYHRDRPCKGCPFSRGPNAVRGLRPGRMEEIVSADGGFACHEDDYSNGRYRSNPRQCAGYLIFNLVNESCPQMMRIMGRIGAIDDESLLKHEAEVFTDLDELCEAQEG